MSRLGAKIQRQRATEARAARRLIRELLPPPPAVAEAARGPERSAAHKIAGALPYPFTPAYPGEPAIAVLLTLILVALFGAVAVLARC